jgi:hypothetical protein
MVRSTALLVFAAVAAFAGHPAAADQTVYKWKDSSGNLHYTQRPPVGIASEAISVKEGYSTRDDAAREPTPEERLAAEKAERERQKAIEAAAAELRTALEGTDPEAIRQKATALQEASYALAEQVYKEAQQSAPAGDGATASADDESDEEIIEDAEVVDPDATARS